MCGHIGFVAIYRAIYLLWQRRPWKTIFVTISVQTVHLKYIIHSLLLLPPPPPLLLRCGTDDTRPLAVAPSSSTARASFIIHDIATQLHWHYKNVRIRNRIARSFKTNSYMVVNYIRSNVIYCKHAGQLLRYIIPTIYFAVRINLTTKNRIHGETNIVSDMT